MQHRQANRISVMALAAVIGLAFPQMARANLLTNGSFETGDFTGWTGGGNFEFTQVVSGPFYVYSGAQDGTWYATLGAVGSDGTLSQSFSDTAGTTLNISFYLAAVGDDPSDFTAQFNGANLTSVSDPNTGGGYTQDNFNVTATGSDTFSIAFRDDPAYIAVDNFSITPASAVPEPSSIALLGFALLSLAGFGWSKRSRT